MESVDIVSDSRAEAGSDYDAELRGPWVRADDPFVVISGGQSGVDRAALDSAMQAALPCGGWCPIARWAEDGPIDFRYPLLETDDARLSDRTSRNVRDADGTLILSPQPLTGGTKLTFRLARRTSKPVLVIDTEESDAIVCVLDWIRDNGIRVLNVAGLRESVQPGIYERAKQFLDVLFSSIHIDPRHLGRRDGSNALQSEP